VTRSRTRSTRVATLRSTRIKWATFPRPGGCGHPCRRLPG
jgi:hypothetical protein